MKQAVLQQNNKIAYATLQCTETVYFGNVIIDGLDLDVPVINLRYGWFAHNN